MTTKYPVSPDRRVKKAEVAEPEKLESGRFRGHVWDPYRQCKEPVRNPDYRWDTFATEREFLAAQIKLKTEMDAMYEDASGFPVVRQRHERPFEEVAREWLGKQKKGTDRSRTARKSAVNVLCRQFGTSDIRDISEDSYRDFMEYEAVELDRAPATLENRMIYMRQIMTYAVKMKYIDADQNPMEEIELPKVYRKTETRVLDDDEFLFLAPFLPDWFRPAAYLGYDCGLRAAEVAGLSWQHLRLDGDEPAVFVRDVAEKNKKIREHTKGSLLGEWITLTARSVDALATLKASRPKDGPAHRVFRNEQGTLMDPSTPSRVLVLAWAAAKMTGTRATFHALRHSFVTNMALAGVLPHVIMARARHKSFDVTMKYVKAADLEAQREAMAQVERMQEAKRAAALAATEPAVPTVPPGQGVYVPPEMAALLMEMLKGAQAPETGLVAA